jgi:hypothetical protein
MTSYHEKKQLDFTNHENARHNSKALSFEQIIGINTVIKRNTV